MPLHVLKLAVAAFWDDSKYWEYGQIPQNFALRGMFTRHQLQRPMTGPECTVAFGAPYMTGQPWVGKERSFLHGRGKQLLHSRVSISNYPGGNNMFHGVVLCPLG